MDELLGIANKLGGVSFATLLVVILYGSWKRIWLWGRELDALELRVAREKQAIYDDRDFWRDVAIRATGIAEVQGQILKVKQSGQMDDINKHLLE